MLFTKGIQFLAEENVLLLYVRKEERELGLVGLVGQGMGYDLIEWRASKNI
jgi:hypothetical protein